MVTCFSLIMNSSARFNFKDGVFFFHYISGWDGPMQEAQVSFGMTLTQRYFCGLGKADLSQGCLNPKQKLEVTICMHYSEIKL